MKILVLYRHFWPDSPPYASMLRSIAVHLQSEGHEVRVVCEQPSYKVFDGAGDSVSSELIDGVHITRFLYHCQDLYPEIAVHTGLIAQGGLLHRLMTRLEHTTRRNADMVVALSYDMIKTIRKTLAKPKGRYATLNNFQLESFTEEPASGTSNALSPFGQSDSTKIVFAGNLGQFQGLDKIVSAVKDLGGLGARLELLFIGDGKAKSSLVQGAETLSNVRFLDHMPFDEVKAIISQSDYGLVSLEPGIYKYAYPSKTLTYLGLDVPVIAVIEEGSELARTINKHNIGYCSNGFDREDISRMLRVAIEEQKKQPEQQQNAKAYYSTYCERARILASWSGIINSLAPLVGSVEEGRVLS